MAQVTLLKVRIDQRGMQFPEFEREYRQVAAALLAETGDRAFRGVTVSSLTYSRWRDGQTGRPRNPAPAILERMFDEPISALLSPWSGERVAGPSEQMPDESDLRMTARDAHSHATEAAAQVLPDLSLDQVEDDLVRLIRSTDSTPPHQVYSQGKELLGLAKIMLDRTQVLSQRRRLYILAGEASALLATSAFDLGSLPVAVELVRASALYGQVSEHDALQAYSYGYLAVLAYWSGNPSVAVQHVEKAQRFGGVGATGQTRLAAIAARAYAHLGRAADAQQAILASLQDRGTTRDDVHDDIGGEFDFPLDRVTMSNSTTLLLLRDGEGAEQSARRSLDLITQGAPTTTPRVVAAQARTDLAMALLLRRQLDEAADELRPVLALLGSGVAPG